MRDYIYAGDCYQINLAQRFAAPAAGDPWLAYQALRIINPAPYSAYLNTPHGQVLSASPERFLKLHGRNVETKPIKGTRARSAGAAPNRATSSLHLACVSTQRPCATSQLRRSR